MLFEPVLEALDGARVRYVVVGGLATVLHGFARLTADVDLVVDLETAAAARTMEALLRLGLTPRAPVDAAAFADPVQRRAWANEKGMRVFSMWCPAQPMLEVDLFVESPIEFSELWSRAEIVSLGRVDVRIASIPDLVAMKRLAGRPEDHQDIEALLEIQRRKEGLRG